MADGRKSLGAAYALLLTFGYVGAHRFYLERPFSGGLQALMTLTGLGLLFFLLGDVYRATLAMLSGQGYSLETGILEGAMSEAQRRAVWAAFGCLGGAMVWLLGDFLTMPFWRRGKA